MLADVEAPTLDNTVAELTDEGHTTIGVVTDVTDLDSVRHLADEAYAAFGAVNILCNSTRASGRHVPRSGRRHRMIGNGRSASTCSAW